MIYETIRLQGPGKWQLHATLLNHAELASHWHIVIALLRESGQLDALSEKHTMARAAEMEHPTIASATDYTHQNGFTKLTQAHPLSSRADPP